MKCNFPQQWTVYELSAIQKRWSGSKKSVFGKKCAKIAYSKKIKRLRFLIRRQSRLDILSAGEEVGDMRCGHMYPSKILFVSRIFCTYNLDIKIQLIGKVIQISSIVGFFICKNYKTAFFSRIILHGCVLQWETYCHIKHFK